MHIPLRSVFSYWNVIACLSICVWLSTSEICCCHIKKTHLFFFAFIFWLAILIPACASSSPAFLMMYSAYKLNKQSDSTGWQYSLDILLFLFWKDPDAGKDWRWEEKGTTEDDDGWIASLTQWTWLWVNSGCWWWTGRPGVLQSTGLQRVATELLNWAELIFWPC